MKKGGRRHSGPRIGGAVHPRSKIGGVKHNTLPSYTPRGKVPSRSVGHHGMDEDAAGGGAGDTGEVRVRPHTRAHPRTAPPAPHEDAPQRKRKRKIQPSQKAEDAEVLRRVHGLVRVDMARDSHCGYRGFGQAIHETYPTAAQELMALIRQEDPEAVAIAHEGVRGRVGPWVREHAEDLVITLDHRGKEVQRLSLANTLAEEGADNIDDYCSRVVPRTYAGATELLSLATMLRVRVAVLSPPFGIDHCRVLLGEGHRGIVTLIHNGRNTTGGHYDMGRLVGYGEWHTRVARPGSNKVIRRRTETETLDLCGEPVLGDEACAQEAAAHVEAEVEAEVDAEVEATQVALEAEAAQAAQAAENEAEEAAEKAELDIVERTCPAAQRGALTEEAGCDTVNVQRQGQRSPGDMSHKGNVHTGAGQHGQSFGRRGTAQPKKWKMAQVQFT
jgi:hypothetical protein